MSDLISREAALRKMRDVLSRTKFMGSRFAMTYLTNCFNALLKAVKDAPTVDAVPVVHGHWIYHVDDLFPTDSTQECSVCHEEEYMTLRHENYCPNCGAKMDGDKREPLE